LDSARHTAALVNHDGAVFKGKKLQENYYPSTRNIVMLATWRSPDPWLD